MTIAQIESKLEQRKTAFAQSENSLSGLRSERAKLSLRDTEKNKTKITSLDKQIGRVIADSQNLPSEIEVLESELALAQEKQEHQERNRLLVAQKKAAVQVEELSKQFVEILEQAVAVNNKLDLHYREYCRLRVLTKENCISKCICLGSMGSLKYLFEICQKEMQGNPVFRQPMTAIPI